MAMVLRGKLSSLTHSMLGGGFPEAVHERLNDSRSEMAVMLLVGCVCITGGTTCVGGRVTFLINDNNDKMANNNAGWFTVTVGRYT